MWRLSVPSVFVALLVTANCSNGVGQAQEPQDGEREKPSPRARAGQSAHGLELSIHAGEFARPGEPVYLWLVLRNRSKNAHTVPRLDPRYRSPAVDLQGVAVEVSPVCGEKVRIEVPSERAAPMRVAAGQIVSVKVPVHFTYRKNQPHWWLRKHDIYAVRVHYGFRVADRPVRLTASVYITLDEGDETDRAAADVLARPEIVRFLIEPSGRQVGDAGAVLQGLVAKYPDTVGADYARVVLGGVFARGYWKGKEFARDLDLATRYLERAMTRNPVLARDAARELERVHKEQGTMQKSAQTREALAARFPDAAKWPGWSQPAAAGKSGK